MPFGVGVGVTLGVAVALGVALGDGVRVGVRRRTGVGERRGKRVDVTVGVSVPVTVAVAEGVARGVTLGVGLGDGVRDGDGVAVGVTDGCAGNGGQLAGKGQGARRSRYHKCFASGALAFRPSPVSQPSYTTVPAPTFAQPRTTRCSPAAPATTRLAHTPLAPVT